MEMYVLKEDIKNVLVNNTLQNVAVHEYGITDSTNTRAKLFAKNRCVEEKTPAIFLSRAQSAGRGTRGRGFESPIGAGLYISYLIYPDCSVSAADITTYAAVACCRALEKIGAADGLKPRIKWVNDIYVGARKLSGILTEGELDESGKLKYAVVGIGINLRRGEHSHEVASIMTTLEDEGVSVSFEQLYEVLTEEFFSALAKAGTAEIMKEYRDLSMLIGRAVRIVTGGRQYDERVTDIDSDGALITQDVHGNVKKYISGDVSVRL